jgi:hypothetical protein
MRTEESGCMFCAFPPGILSSDICNRFGTIPYHGETND